MRLDRPREAIAALQPALRGDLDAGALYVTHTEVHEELAQAFDRAKMTDSAAAHYRAVIKAWAGRSRVLVATRHGAELARSAPAGSDRVSLGLS